MDFFGDDEPESGAEGEDSPSSSNQDKVSPSLIEISQEILKYILNHREHHISCEILFLIDSMHKEIDDLIHKLQQIKVGLPTVASSTEVATGMYYPSTSIKRIFDFVVDCRNIESLFKLAESTSTPSVSIEEVSHLVTPGGHYLYFDRSDSEEFPILTSSHLWVGDAQASSLSSGRFYGLKKRSICCNTRAALYWGASGVDTCEKARKQLLHERELLEDITVTQPVQRSANYIKYGSNKGAIKVTEDPLLRISNSGRDKAMNALKKHGFCIIRGVFPTETIQKWGEASLRDLEIASDCLKSTRGIDLENPIEGQIINNFHELSMREARRVDLRNGVNVKKMIEDEENKWRGNADCDKLDQSLGDIRMNPDILDILERAMYEMTPREMGNWGRWNFNGGGPSLTRPIPLTVGKPGAVVSLGGCIDQTIHADTSHIFSHVQLPPHYVNLFLYVVASFSDVQEQRFGSRHTGKITEDGLLCGCCDLRVGQTVFIAGSQDLLVTDKCMNHGEKGEDEIMRRIVRPQLQTGDILLFDCRILHFGLANETSTSSVQPESSGETMIKRPIVYVNYHHKWFNDPKNWNDNERLF